MKACFYHRETGVFHAYKYVGPIEQLANNTPADHLVYLEEVDPLSAKFDLETGNILDYVPPQPSADHEWNPEIKRWRIKPEVSELNFRSVTAKAKLQALDQSELRAISDLLAHIEFDNPSEAAQDDTQTPTPDEDEHAKLLEARAKLLEVRAQKDIERAKLK